MKKVLITYASLSGNTKKLAEGLYDAFQEEAHLQPVDEEIDLSSYDVILHGYWVDRGGPDEKSKAFLSRIQNKKVGIFATLGAYPDSEHAASSLEKGVQCLDASNTLIGKFICQGRLSDAIKDRIRKLPKDHPHGPTEARLKRWADADSHPDEADIQKAISVFKNVW